MSYNRVQKTKKTKPKIKPNQTQNSQETTTQKRKYKLAMYGIP